MPDTQKKFYLTTPIYYVNARPTSATPTPPLRLTLSPAANASF